MIDLPPPDPGIEIVVASRGYSKGLAQTDGVQVRAQPELAFGPVYVAVYAKNDSDAYLVGKRLIEAGKSPDAKWIADPTAKLKALLRT